MNKLAPLTGLSVLAAICALDLASASEPPKLDEAAATLAINEYAEKNCDGLMVDYDKMDTYFKAGGFTADQLRKTDKYRHVREIDIPGDLAKHSVPEFCYAIQNSYYVPNDLLRHKMIFKP